MNAESYGLNATGPGNMGINNNAYHMSDDEHSIDYNMYYSN